MVKTKKDYGIKWYSLDEILKHNAQYYIIFGERSNGKSYACSKMVLEKAIENNEMFAIIKRYDIDMKANIMETYFSLDLQDYIEKKYKKRIRFYRGAWYIYDSDIDTPTLKQCTQIGYALALTTVNRTKGANYPLVETVIFEEFMSIDCKYLKDEVNLLVNLISTIARQRHTVKIFMLANAISKYSIYSDALSIRLHRMEKGQIITREYKDDRGYTTRFVIQRTENVNVYDNSQNTEKIVYSNFGNSGVGKMITTGDFEVHAYKRRVNGMTFSENRLNKNERVFMKKDKIPFILKFEDYYYRIFLAVSNSKYTLGFREVSFRTINPSNTYFIINGVDMDIENVPVIKNLASFDNDNINQYLDIIVKCLKEGDFITLTDDDGENVVNGFRMVNINI